MYKERKAAIERGDVRYISSTPCVNGHVSERYTQNGQCIECKQMQRRGKRTKCPPKVRSELTKRLHREVREEKGLAWLSGATSIKSSKTIKLILSDINGYKCAVCGVSEWQSKAISLELEHIDGNSENNSPNNVCLICPNCHSQTPTYKARNKGNGRHYRRQRYAEGKSY